MKKIYTTAVAMTMFVAMVSAQTRYVKVQSEPADWTGTYLIVYEANDETNEAYVFDGALTGKNLDSKNNFFSATNAAQDVNGEQIRVIDDSEQVSAAVFNVTRSEDGSAYYIQSASGYYIGYDNAEKGEPNLEYDNENAKLNTIAMEEGKTSVNVIGSVGNYQLRFNADEGKERFRYHELGKKKSIKFYQKVENNTSGISNLKSESSAHQVCNLHGQLMQGLQKGLNVVDGKVVFYAK